MMPVDFTRRLPDTKDVDRFERPQDPSLDKGQASAIGVLSSWPLRPIQDRNRSQKLICYVPSFDRPPIQHAAGIKESKGQHSSALQWSCELTLPSPGFPVTTGDEPPADCPSSVMLDAVFLDARRT
jgi:hypothetical protein